LGYEQVTLRALVFVGIGSEKKCMADPHFSRLTVDGDVLENGGHKLQEKPRASSGTRTGGTSIELWNSSRKKGRTHQTKENGNVRRWLWQW
jgi:hypothetical protein